MLNTKYSGPPSFEAVLAYARHAVQSERVNPASRMLGYDRQSVLDDVLNHFNGAWVGGVGGAPLALDADRDEELIRQAVREAEESC